MEKRTRSNYRGQSKSGAVFGNCLYCKDCGGRLTPVLRDRGKERRYYICNTYNTRGKCYCEHTHMVYEEDLKRDITVYLKLCRETFSERIAVYRIEELSKGKEQADLRRQSIIEALARSRNQLKVLLAQKLKDISEGTDSNIIAETYEVLWQELMARIHGYELQLKELEDKSSNQSNVRDRLSAALVVMDYIIEREDIDRRDVEVLVEKIIINKDGFPEIELKYGLGSIAANSLTDKLNRNEQEILRAVLRLIGKRTETILR